MCMCGICSLASLLIMISKPRRRVMPAQLSATCPTADEVVWAADSIRIRACGRVAKQTRSAFTSAVCKRDSSCGQQHKRCRLGAERSSRAGGGARSTACGLTRGASRPSTPSRRLREGCEPWCTHHVLRRRAHPRRPEASQREMRCPKPAQIGTGRQALGGRHGVQAGGFACHVSCLPTLACISPAAVAFVSRLSPAEYAHRYQVDTTLIRFARRASGLTALLQPTPPNHERFSIAADLPTAADGVSKRARPRADKTGAASARRRLTASPTQQGLAVQASDM